MSDNEIRIDSETSPKKYDSKATLAQWLAVIVHSFLFIGSGLNIAIPTIVIRDLYKKSNNDFSITVTEASWYGSLLFIIHPVGCFLSGIMQEKFGKKRCMILSNVPSIIGWILLYFAYSSVILYASILLMGLSTGFGSGSTSTYVGEISEPRLRGSLGSLGSTSMRIGTLFIYIMGTYFDWRTVALFCSFFPFISLCLITLIPESPMWLISKGKNEKAEISMCWLRGWVEPEKIKHEFVELIQYNKLSGNQNGNVNTINNNLFSKLVQFKDPSVYRPFRLVMISFFIAFISGLFLTRPFIFKIMTEIDLLNNQNEIMAILSSLSFLGSIIATATVHRTGIRVLTLSTLSIVTFSLFLFGTYILAFKNNYMPSFPGIPFILLCSVYLFGSCGIVCMPWMILIEVFPNKNRGIATSICAGLAYVLLFILTKSYLLIEMTLSLEYTMILFGFIGFLGLIYLYLYLPETKKKTLLQIEEFFASNSKR